MTIFLEPIESVSITVLVDNSADLLQQSQGPATHTFFGDLTGPRIQTRFLDVGSAADAPKAEHGFSAMVSVTKENKTHRILFDSGVTPDGMVENMARLQVDPKDIETIVLSHGHFDHTTGMEGLVRRLGRANLPVLIHPDFWSKRRIAIPGREALEIPTTSKSALIETGFEIIEDRYPSFLLDGSVLVTGEVDRTTDFETGFPIHQKFHNGAWEADPLILDDQALVLNVRDKGLVVLTGCGHAGIVNIVRYAKSLTGVDTVHAVMGGFHLNGPLFAPVVPPTCEALAQLSPNYIVPAHCTDWHATAALAQALPDAFIKNAVGSRYDF